MILFSIHFRSRILNIEKLRTPLSTVQLKWRNGTFLLYGSLPCAHSSQWLSLNARRSAARNIAMNWTVSVRSRRITQPKRHIKSRKEVKLADNSMCQVRFQFVHLVFFAFRIFDQYSNFQTVTRRKFGI